MLDRPSKQSISTLKRVIHDAFDGVRLGQGVGLWEGQALDDYECFETRQQARLRDEKVSWEKVSVEDLNRCASSLSFFDAEGMRFHLPAFMMLEINGEDEAGGLMFHLTHLDEYMISRYSMLNQTQRDAIFDFLRWCQGRPEYEYDEPELTQAMNGYWSKNAESTIASNIDLVRLVGVFHDEAESCAGVLAHQVGHDLVGMQRVGDLDA